MRRNLYPAGHSKHSAPHSPAEVAVASVGVAIVVCSLVARQRWLDSHFLPSFFLSRNSYVLVESAIRFATAGFGLVVVFFARRAGRFIGKNPGRAFYMA